MDSPHFVLLKHLLSVFLIYMKTKDYWITWLWTAILMYFLYDIVWILADHEEFNNLIEDGCTILWIDLCYCFLFALYNLGFGIMLLRSRFMRFFQRKKVLVFSAFFIIADTFLAFLVENILDVMFVEVSNREVWGNAYLMGLISSIQALIVAVEYFYKESQQKYEENRRLEMQLLKMQMNPHFVFNSLSVLAGLIDIDKKRAENYVIRLSRIYRHILGHIENDVVSLDEAFLWLDDYIALLQIRYANVELVMKPMDKHPNDYILSQSLQVLVENAVKHNALNQNKKLIIVIERKDNMLVVSNNIILPAYKIKQSIPSHKLGLDNLAKRYLIKFGKDIRILHTSESFTVYLPIVNHE